MRTTRLLKCFLRDSQRAAKLESNWDCFGSLGVCLKLSEVEWLPFLKRVKFVFC